MQLPVGMSKMTLLQYEAKIYNNGINSQEALKLLKMGIITSIIACRVALFR